MPVDEAFKVLGLKPEEATLEQINEVCVAVPCISSLPCHVVV